MAMIAVGKMMATTSNTIINQTGIDLLMLRAGGLRPATC